MAQYEIGLTGDKRYIADPRVEQAQLEFQRQQMQQQQQAQAFMQMLEQQRMAVDQQRSQQEQGRYQQGLQRQSMLDAQEQQRYGQGLSRQSMLDSREQGRYEHGLQREGMLDTREQGRYDQTIQRQSMLDSREQERYEGENELKLQLLKISELSEQAREERDLDKQIKLIKARGSVESEIKAREQAAQDDTNSRAILGKSALDIAANPESAQAMGLALRQQLGDSPEAIKKIIEQLSHYAPKLPEEVGDQRSDARKWLTAKFEDMILNIPGSADPYEKFFGTRDEEKGAPTGADYEKFASDSAKFWEPILGNSEQSNARITEALRKAAQSIIKSETSIPGIQADQPNASLGAIEDLLRSRRR